MSVLGYLDPATGSLIAATVAGGVAGVGVAAKSMWRNKTERFRKSKPEDTPEQDEQGSEEPEDSTESDVEYAAKDDS